MAKTKLATRTVALLMEIYINIRVSAINAQIFAIGVTSIPTPPFAPLDAFDVQ